MGLRRFGNPIAPRMHDGRLILSLRVPNIHPNARLEASPARVGSDGGEAAFCTPPRSASKNSERGDDAHLGGERDTDEVCGPAGAAAAAAAAAGGASKSVTRENQDLVGYEAIATNEVLDLSKVGEHLAENFFRPVQTSVRGGRLTLEKVCVVACLFVCFVYLFICLFSCVCAEEGSRWKRFVCLLFCLFCTLAV
jgi:hypothetical protein